MAKDQSSTIRCPSCGPKPGGGVYCPDCGEVLLHGKASAALPHLRSLVQTCEACPSQWEGETMDGRKVYVRYRWGHLQVGIANTITEAVDESMRDLGKQLGEEFDGYMNTDEMLRVTGFVREDGWVNDGFGI